MSTNGEAADLAVRESIEITESAVKLAGLGAKNLAALLIALANDNQKVAGLTNLRRLMQDGDQKVVFSIKAEDMNAFAEKAKDFGVLYVTVKHKAVDTDKLEIITRASDVHMINHIMEDMGYPAPSKEDAAAKKAEPRVPSERSSKERGRGATETPTEPTVKKTSSRKSIKPTLNGMRQKSEALDKRNRAREAVKTALNKAAPER